MCAVHWVIGTVLTASLFVPLPMNHIAAVSVSPCVSIGSVAQVTGPPVCLVLLTELGSNHNGHYYKRGAPQQPAKGA